jgi:taurine dioxygenase
MNLNFISPVLGVYVEALSLKSGPIAEIAAQIRMLLEKHQVVILRNQRLDATELREFVSHFGPLFHHHADEGVLHADGLSEVLEMRKEPEGIRLFGGTDWHADVTFRKPAAYASCLHAKVLPPLGGDTCFASTLAAWQTLSPGFQAFLENLTAVHSYNGPGQPEHKTQTALHPVVRTHPHSGQKGLYFNRMFGIRFDQMTEDESRPIIEYLNTHMSRPEFTFRHQWQPGDLVIWDNRFTLHYPINDFTGHLRSLIRCTAMESE